MNKALQYKNYKKNNLNRRVEDLINEEVRQRLEEVKSWKKKEEFE